MTRAPMITEFADQSIIEAGILENPYFILLRSGNMNLESFKVSQEQFYHAVNFFPRPMAALIARIPSARTRLDILHNLVEEHGEFDEQAFHCTTFKRFLASLESKKPLSGQPIPEMSAAVHAFNSVLLAACALDEVETGIACLGIIEHSFAHIAAMIGRAVVQNGWVPPEKLVHYRLHAEIDERHAEEFYAAIEASYSDGSKKASIEQGIRLGLYAFNNLYLGLAEIASAAKPEHRLPDNVLKFTPALAEQERQWQ